MSSVTKVSLIIETDAKREVVEYQDAISESSWSEIEIASGTSDYSISFGGVDTATTVYLLSDADLTFKLNGTGTEIDLLADRPAVFCGTSLTSITITNAETTLANLRYFVATATSSTTLNHTGVVTVYNIVDYGAEGDGTTDDTSAIQDAIDACPEYGTVYAPKGDYLVTGSINITKSIRLIGSGFGSIFYVDPSVAGTTDIFCVTPSASNIYYLEFRDFCVAPKSSAAGRHCINVNGTSGYIKDCQFDNLLLYALNGYAIYATGGGAEGNPILTTISNSVLVNGVTITTASDTVRLLNNHISGAGYGFNITCVSGASTFIAEGNSITNKDGAKIYGLCVAAQIRGNEFESLADATLTNGCLLYIDGPVGSEAADTMILNNSFQVVNGIEAMGVTVNHAVRTFIQGNRFGRGIGSSRDIYVMANASDTIIGPNIFASAGTISEMILDSGTETNLMMMNNGSIVLGTSARATDATDGFLYIPSCAGTPTGVPTSYSGMVPLVYDSTNHKLYAYDSGWKDMT